MVEKTLGEFLWESLDTTDNTEIVSGAWINLSWDDLPERTQEQLQQSAEKFLLLRRFNLATVVAKLNRN